MYFPRKRELQERGSIQSNFILSISGLHCASSAPGTEPPLLQHHLNPKGSVQSKFQLHFKLTTRSHRTREVPFLTYGGAYSNWRRKQANRPQAQAPGSYGKAVSNWKGYVLDPKCGWRTDSSGLRKRRECKCDPRCHDQPTPVGHFTNIRGTRGNLHVP